MLVLAIDPGETIGFVSICYRDDGFRPAVLVQEEARLSFAQAVITIRDGLTRPYLTRLRHDVVVVEDYRVYASKASMHIGNCLYTAQLIGAIRALCILEDIRVVVLPASKKGRWPNARLRAKFPGHGVEGVHALDALKLGLAYIEKELAWIP